MAYSVKYNKAAFNHLFDKGYFDFISQNNELVAQFDEGMKNLSSEEEEQIKHYFSFNSNEIIVDIGGGKGSFIASILENSHNTCGILYDLPCTIETAKQYLSNHGCFQRITCCAGSFFDSIPANADAYILKRILHDWNDEECIAILSNCKKAMKSGARLFIVEAIVAATNERDFAKDIDIAMLTLFGGKERTLAEWHSLIKRAGLHITRVCNTDTLMHIIEISA